MRILLDQGADVNTQAGYFDTALLAASAKGHEKVVEMLTKRGADVKVQRGYYGNALYVASIGGYEKVVDTVG